MVALNRAIALAMAEGPAPEGLEGARAAAGLASRITTGSTRPGPICWSEVGRAGEGGSGASGGAGPGGQPAERRLLERRLAALTV